MLGRVPPPPPSTTPPAPGGAGGVEGRCERRCRPREEAGRPLRRAGDPTLPARPGSRDFRRRPVPQPLKPPPSQPLGAKGGCVGSSHEVHGATGLTAARGVVPPAQAAVGRNVGLPFCGPAVVGGPPPFRGAVLWARCPNSPPLLLETGGGVWGGVGAADSAGIVEGRRSWGVTPSGQAVTPLRARPTPNSGLVGRCRGEGRRVGG